MVHTVHWSGGYQGGVWDRVGTGEGYTGTQSSCSGRGADTAERAPEAPQGLEWVVSAARAPVQDQYHPAGPVGVPAGPLPVLALPSPECRLLANNGEIRVQIQ